MCCQYVACCTYVLLFALLYASAWVQPHGLLQGFEIGSGFAGSRLLGSEHNDEFYMAPDGQIRTRTNR